MAQWSANINVMMKVIRRAARGLLRDFNEVEKLQSTPKGTADFTDKAKARTGEYLQEALFEARETYGYTDGVQNIAGVDPTRRWIVSPLDGVVNFTHALPFWAISVALEHRGAVVASVIYNPISDELYVAERGAGAWLNDQRIRVSARRDVGQCVFALTDAGDGGVAQGEWMRAMQARISARGGGLRMLEASCLGLVWLAMGRFDGFLQSTATPVQVAAGLMVLQEAGGMSKWIDSADDKEDKTPAILLAANGEIFDPFCKLVLSND